MRLFHLLDEAALERAAAAGSYTPSSLETEGFIHLSTEAQWPVTARRFFAESFADLVLLELELDDTFDVRFEAADGDAFPHLYGPLPISCVVAVHSVAPDASGTFAITQTHAP